MNETDPRVKRTRKLLQDAFMALLAEKSFHAISVQDIAERATLNRATFYAHFEDKYALMDYMIGEYFREALRRRLPVGAPFTLDNLHLLLVTVCEYLAEFQGHCAPAGRDLDPRIEARVQQEIYTVLLGWLTQAQAAALPSGAARTSRETAASVMSWAIFGAASEWSRSERRLSAESLARQILALIVGGLSALVDVPSPQVRRIEEPAHGTRR
jgi:AcrR family transcriptional regulator